MHKCCMARGALIQIPITPLDGDLVIEFLRQFGVLRGITCISSGPGHVMMFVSDEHLADIRTFCQEHNIELVES